MSMAVMMRWGGLLRPNYCDSSFLKSFIANKSAFLFSVFVILVFEHPLYFVLVECAVFFRLPLPTVELTTFFIILSLSDLTIIFELFPVLNTFTKIFDDFVHPSRCRDVFAVDYRCLLITVIVSIHSFEVTMVYVFAWNSKSFLFAFCPIWSSILFSMCKCDNSSIIFVFNNTYSMWFSIEPLSFDWVPVFKLALIELDATIVLYGGHLR